jgi:hypothetical protein
MFWQSIQSEIPALWRNSGFWWIQNPAESLNIGRTKLIDHLCSACAFQSILLKQILSLRQAEARFWDRSQRVRLFACEVFPSAQAATFDCSCFFGRLETRDTFDPNDSARHLTSTFSDVNPPPADGGDAMKRYCAWMDIRCPRILFHGNKARQNTA